MRFGILGPLDIRADDGTSPDPGGPRPRALLTLLLLEAGRTVSARRLIDGLYGTEPPAGAANALQSQISRLRGRLRPHTEIEITSAGYRIAVPPEAVDAHLFEQMSRDGRAALAAGDHPQAAARLREALALWRGPALPDLPDAYAEVARLDELRLAAVQDRIEADLMLGGGPELVPEVRALLAAHPLSERLYGQLMRALHASGRPAEALGVYEEARSALARELGADPSPDLAALHLELLRGEAPAPRRPPGTGPAHPLLRPPRRTGPHHRPPDRLRSPTAPSDHAHRSGRGRQDPARVRGRAGPRGHLRARLRHRAGAPDLVIGADGLHSRTRSLVFGDESRHLRFLGHYVAGFAVPNDLGLDRTGRLYSEPGRAIAVGNYGGDPDRANALLVFRSERLSFDRRDVAAQKRILAERFAGMGWEAPHVLDALETADDLYFDAIAQMAHRGPGGPPRGRGVRRHDGRHGHRCRGRRRLCAGR